MYSHHITSFIICMYFFWYFSFISVCGFDHAAFDERLENWSENWFPYRLANYEKKILGTPIIAIDLDYSEPVQTIDTVCRKMVIETEGRLDCVVVWVDYVYHENILGGDVSDKNWNGNFPSYLTVMVKFLDSPVAVLPADEVSSEVGFQHGESDFTFNFSLSNKRL